MTMMLPAKPVSTWNLKDVFQSAEASIRGLHNPLGLAGSASAIVVMVDGLGYENLTGQAGFLAKHLKVDDFAHCGFPSTTVASIASFANAKESSEHGLIGYSIFNRSSGETVNLLSGLDRFSILDYLKVEPISAHSTANIHAVTLEQYEATAFTQATMQSAKHHFASDLETRFDIALQIVTQEENALVYLYVPELDREAHLSGVNSQQWSELLDRLDRATQKLVAKIAPEVGMLLTADHGVINIAFENHIYLDECQALRERFQSVCGDPRAAFIYLKDSDDLQLATMELESFLRGRAVAVTPQQLVQQGYWMPSILEDDDLIPDLVAISIDEVAIFHRNFAKTNSLKMVGHHGAVSLAEVKVPLMRFGAYSSSLLVP
jgi:hypothetical protein